MFIDVLLTFIPSNALSGNLDALLPLGGGGGAAANLLEAMANDVDDEAMVELAIALSLQEQGQQPGADAAAGGAQGGANNDQQLEANLQHGLRGLQQGLEQLVNLGPDLQGLPALQGLAGMLGGAMGNLDHDVLGGNPLGEGPGDQPENEENQNPAAVAGAAAAAPVVVGGAVGGANNLDPSHFSDTTASAPASDDEGSTSAMDGSALRY